MTQIIKLNVGGIYFTTTLSTLQALPKESVLSTMFLNTETISPAKKDDQGFFFIDRNPSFFGYILDIHRNVKLPHLREIKDKGLKKEIKYWFPCLAVKTDQDITIGILCRSFVKRVTKDLESSRCVEFYLPKLEAFNIDNWASSIIIANTQYANHVLLWKSHCMPIPYQIYFLLHSLSPEERKAWGLDDGYKSESLLDILEMVRNTPKILERLQLIWNQFSQWTSTLNHFAIINRLCKKLEANLGENYKIKVYQRKHLCSEVPIRSNRLHVDSNVSFEKANFDFPLELFEKPMSTLTPIPSCKNFSIIPCDCYKKKTIGEETIGYLDYISICCSSNYLIDTNIMLLNELKKIKREMKRKRAKITE